MSHGMKGSSTVRNICRRLHPCLVLLRDGPHCGTIDYVCEYIVFYSDEHSVLNLSPGMGLATLSSRTSIASLHQLDVHQLDMKKATMTPA